MSEYDHEDEDYDHEDEDYDHGGSGSGGGYLSIFAFACLLVLLGFVLHLLFVALLMTA